MTVQTLNRSFRQQSSNLMKRDASAKRLASADSYQMVENLCRTCETWDTFVAPGPILVSDLCDAYATDTTTISECEYLFYAYGICGDAINCELVSCRNTTTIEGSISESGDTLTAEAEWEYEVTFSYGTLDPPSENTGQCVGSASVDGEHR